MYPVELIKCGDDIEIEQYLDFKVTKITIDASQAEIIANELLLMAGVKKPRKVFVKPNIVEVEDYSDEQGHFIRGVDFIDFYESKGWLVGKSKMKCWKSAVRNWIKRAKTKDEQGGKFDKRGRGEKVSDRLNQIGTRSYKENPLT